MTSHQFDQHSLLDTMLDEEENSAIDDKHVEDDAEQIFSQLLKESAMASDAMAYYLKLGMKAELLTHEEEIALTEKVARGDRRAWEKMVVCNLRLVVNIARKFQNQGVPLIDLVSEGNLGLMTAVDKFDPSLGYKFSTYATWWVRQSVQRGLLDMQRTVRWPVHYAEMHRRYNKLKREYELKSEELTYDIIEQEIGLTKEQVESLVTFGGSTISLDKSYQDDGAPMVESMADERRASSAKLVGDIEVADMLRNALSGYLDERAQKVLRLRFGIDCAPQTLEQVSEVVGVTRERIRQIESDALKKLKLRLVGRGAVLKDHVL